MLWVILKLIIRKNVKQKLVIWLVRIRVVDFVTISQRVAYLKLLLSKNLTFNFSIEFFEGSLDTKEAMLWVISKLIIRKNVKRKLEVWLVRVWWKYSDRKLEVTNFSHVIAWVKLFQMKNQTFGACSTSSKLTFWTPNLCPTATF